MLPQRAFTIRYGGRVNVLKTEIGIFLPLSEEEIKRTTPQVRPCIAVWDTGANGTVITKQVADELGLKPIGITEVYHAQGKGLTSEYLVNVAILNGVVVTGVRVSDGVLAGCDVILGLALIALGAFAVTNANVHGGTTLSFCIPSVAEIDFVPQSRENEIRRIGNREARRALKKKHR